VFFLTFDNQILFLILTLFPAWLTFTALAWDHSDTPARTFGIPFIAPLLLSILSFLHAPVHRDSADLLLFGAGLAMTVLMTGAELASKKYTASLIICLIALLSPLAFLAMLGKVPVSLLRSVSMPVMGFAVALLAFLMVYALIRGNRQDAARRFGALLAAAGMLLHTLLQESTAIPLILAMVAFGLLVQSVQFHLRTLAVLHKTVEMHEISLNRINEHVQIEVTRRVESIEKSNRVLLERSKTDSLTGLYGKGAILSSADLLLHRRQNESLSLVMLDIDYFKSINDKLGHPTGDRCLKALANIARSTFRSNDILGRYGGDEFIFLLPQTPAGIATVVAERFRSNIEMGSDPKFTVSIGVATYPKDGTTPKELIASADHALYKSKEEGRNKVSHFSWAKGAEDVSAAGPVPAAGSPSGMRKT